jgi:deoxycytidylate deaminase
MSGRDWKVELHMAIEAEVGRPINKPICNIIADAGYRILAPGEIDPETVERCAAVADAHEVEQREQRIYKARSQPDHCSYHLHAEQEARAIAARIRHLSDKEQGT